MRIYNRGLQGTCVLRQRVVSSEHRTCCTFIFAEWRTQERHFHCQCVSRFPSVRCRQQWRVLSEGRVWRSMCLRDSSPTRTALAPESQESDAFNSEQVESVRNVAADAARHSCSKSPSSLYLRPEATSNRSQCRTHVS